jgi:hypothetical protein
MKVSVDTKTMDSRLEEKMSMMEKELSNMEKNIWHL